MNFQITFLKVLLCFISVKMFIDIDAVDIHNWNYEDLGPDEWLNEFPQCKGVQQSPINILTSNAVYNANLKPFKFINYDMDLEMNFTNNGHTRSEHHVDNEKFPLELSEGNNTNLNFLTQIIMDDEYVSNSEKVTFNISSILPGIDVLNTDGYYRYIGSLTTPPCTEGIIWSIFRTRINISEWQMESFHKNLVKFNDRDVQELNKRTLYVSTQSSILFNSSNVTTTTTTSQSSTRKFCDILIVVSILMPNILLA